MDRHNRPYKCDFINCAHTTGFGSKGELKRHIDGVHKQPNLSCPVAGCLYSCSRKDNLRDHMNRRHQDRIHERPSTLERDFNSPARNQDISHTDTNRMESPVGVTVREPRKRKRTHEGALSLRSVRSANGEFHGLQEENEKLRRKIEALERKLEASECELESSRKKEETLFEVIRKFTQHSN
jgi:hypothetical protein